MEITQEENTLIGKYLETRDESIIDHVIDHSWAYTFPMVQIAIAFKFAQLAPRRVVCWNSILMEEPK